MVWCIDTTGMWFECTLFASGMHTGDMMDGSAVPRCDFKEKK